MKASISRFLTDRLRLKVNEAKSAGRDPRNVNFSDSVLRMTGASDALRRKLSTSSKTESRKSQ